MIMNSIVEKIRKNRITTALFAVALLALLVVPFLIDNDFVLNVFIWIFVYIILGSAWNLIGGYTGQIALAHGVFVAIGAYCAAILPQYYNITPWLAFLVAPLVAGAIGFVISYPTLKLKGHYFAMVTLAFGFVAWKVFLHWDYINGAAGINIPFKASFSNMIFSTPDPLYYISFVLALGVIALVYVLDRSKLGMYLKAINQDEEAAENRGIDVHKYKVYAMILSAAITSLGGVIYTQHVLFVDPNPFMQGSLMSIRIALVAIVGGLGTLIGPILGSFVMVPLEQYTRAFLSEFGRGYSLFLYGIVIIAIAMYWPKGVAEVIDRIKKRFTGGTNEKAE
jgi:branched-chain amino acid transport system permease protein